MKKTRYITDAAMIAAVMAVLLLIDHLTGGLLIVNFAFVLPVPITLYGLKHDYKKAILPAIAIVFISLIINWLIGLLYVLPSAIVSIIYIVTINKFPHKLGLKVAIMFIGSLIVNLLTTVIFSKALFGYTILEDMTAFANSILDIFSQFGISNDILNNALLAILVSIFPSIIAINSIMEAILSYLIITLLAQRILKINLGGSVLALNIKVPAIVTYIFLPLSLISLFFINNLIDYETFGLVQLLVTIGLNILVMLSLAYIIEAVVVMSMYFARTQRRYLLVVTFLILIFMPILLVIIGFIDSIRPKFSLRSK